MERLTIVSHRIAETLNRAVNPQAPYVGSSAFAHKAGLHVSAIVRAKDAYEHVNPGAGRQRHSLRRVGDGRPGDDPDEGRRPRLDDGRRRRQPGDRRPQAARARGLPLRGRRRLARAADAARRRLGARLLQGRVDARDHRRVEQRRRSPPRPRSRCGSATSATCSRPRATARSTPSTPRCGAAIQQAYPHLANIHLTDYKVRILDGGEATGAVTRVLLSATDGERDWTTIGVSPNIIEASWRALEESVVYGLPPRTPQPDRRLRWAPHGCPQVSPRRTARDRRTTRRPTSCPRPWSPIDRGWSTGSQPVGPRLGAQGPDQGFALVIARRLAPTLHLQPGEREDDVVQGCLGIALRRASMFRRAPVVHDLRIAFTIWGFFDPGSARRSARPARASCSRESATRNHHYAEGRRIADLVPESTLRMTPQQVDAATRRSGSRCSASSRSRRMSTPTGRQEGAHDRAARPERRAGEAGVVQGPARARLLLSEGRHARLHGAGLRAARHRRPDRRHRDPRDQPRQAGRA